MHCIRVRLYVVVRHRIGRRDEEFPLPFLFIFIYRGRLVILIVTTYKRTIAGIEAHTGTLRLADGRHERTARLQVFARQLHGVPLSLQHTVGIEVGIQVVFVAHIDSRIDTGHLCLGERTRDLLIQEAFPFRNRHFLPREHTARTQAIVILAGGRQQFDGIGQHVRVRQRAFEVTLRGTPLASVTVIGRSLRQGFVERIFLR